MSPEGLNGRTSVRKDASKKLASIRLSGQDLGALRIVALRDGRSISEVAEEAIRKYLAQRREGK